jgi:hypothetical protein
MPQIYFVPLQNLTPETAITQVEVSGVLAVRGLLLGKLKFHTHLYNAG